MKWDAIVTAKACACRLSMDQRASGRCLTQTLLSETSRSSGARMRPGMSQSSLWASSL